MPMTKPGQHLRVTDEDNRRPGAPPGRALRRPHHRRDPGQTETPHRHRATVHPSAGGDPARRPRHPRLPTAGTRCRTRLRRCRRGHHHRRRTDPRRRQGHPLPLDPRRIRHRRTDHPRRTLAHPHRPGPARSDPTRGARRLARPRRGRQRPSASPDKPCCTRSNAANCKPSTSTADAAKASVSRSNPTKLDCSTHPDRRRAQC